MLRRFKPLYWIYNFFKKKELSHNVPLYKKYGIDKSYYASVSSKDFKHLDAPKNKFDVLDTKDHLEQEAGFDQLPDKWQEALKGWSANGYAVLENFLNDKEAEAINTEIEEMISNKEVKFRYNGKKIMFAFHRSKLIRDLATGDRLCGILNMLMGKKVALFQSINFLKASEQKTHSDSIHMTTFPLGNLIAVWIALEDIGEDQGPLHYYPKSHTLPYLMNSDFDNEGSSLFLGNKTYLDYEDRIHQLVSKNNLKKQSFHAKKGDLFIWHANLLHGGNPMNNKDLTRKSMVLHYYTTDAICYHELTQRPSFMKENI